MSKQYHYKQLARVIAAGALAGVCGAVSASAFQIQEQDAYHLGTAYAGTAATANQASTGFYNSAGLARLGEEQIAFSGVYIMPSNRLSVTQARASNGANIGSGVSTRRSGSLVPGLHYFNRLSDCWTFGLNVVSPFGLKSNFYRNGIARYTDVRAEMRTYDIAPSLAYCFGNGFSIGAGPDFVYVNTNLATAVGVGDQFTDGVHVNKISRWAYGAHIGALWQITDCTRIGVNYRSELKVKARGTLEVVAPVTFVTERLASHSNFKLPGTAVISGYHDVNDCWALMADAQWTNWKQFKGIGAQTSETTITAPVAYKDSWRFALGTSYAFNDCMLVRLGAAYDASPVRDSSRTVQVPDSNRYWAAIGGRVALSKCVALDLGYSHLFFKKNANINQVAPASTNSRFQGRQTLEGNQRSRADLLGIQLTWDLV